MPQPHGWLPLKEQPRLAGDGNGRCCPSQQAAIPIGAVRVGEVVQRAGLVPNILCIGAIYLVVTLGMCFNGRFARWTSASQARHISVVE
jgi:hypothetical protein